MTSTRIFSDTCGVQNTTKQSWKHNEQKQINFWVRCTTIEFSLVFISSLTQEVFDWLWAFEAHTKQASEQTHDGRRYCFWKQSYYCMTTMLGSIKQKLSLLNMKTTFLCTCLLVPLWLLLSVLIFIVTSFLLHFLPQKCDFRLRKLLILQKAAST